MYYIYVLLLLVLLLLVLLLLVLLLLVFLLLDCMKIGRGIVVIGIVVIVLYEDRKMRQWPPVVEQPSPSETKSEPVSPQVRSLHNYSIIAHQLPVSSTS